MLLLCGESCFILRPDAEVSTAPHRAFVFLSSRWEKRTSRQRIQLIGGVVQAGIVKHPNPLNDKAFEESWGQGTQEIYWATNSCMDLKSKCNHYRWESLDVTKSSYLEPFKSWLANRCFKQRNKSLRSWRLTSSCTSYRESVHLCFFDSRLFDALLQPRILGIFKALIYVFSQPVVKSRITPVCKQSMIFFLYKMNALCFQSVLSNSSGVAL